jgi:NADH-quinone oxidoreductase subunit C
MTDPEIIEKVGGAFPQGLLGHEEFRGDLTLAIRREDIVRVAAFVKEELGFNLVIDVFGIDRFRATGRFEVVYNVYALAHKRYVRLKVTADEDHPVVPTVTGVWPGANWHERETFDMFGIRFEGHPDLRRMYMPDEFEYYPLRKDFPLMGIPDSLPLPRR